MHWDTLFSTKRIGRDKEEDGPRSGFQRDFDRLIFSSAFRRLQDKTQVFPLPGSTFVHTRLTHSLEVASVGRSLGSMVGKKISELEELSTGDAREFYRYELANVIAAGCLAHDVGNPAFGHSGEKAISAYFIDNAEKVLDGRPLRSFFNDAEWADVSNFEGNANAARILTHTFKGRLTGGLGLTYTTIASILKYPCNSQAINKKYKHRKKFGFFRAEEAAISTIAIALGMIPDQQTGCFLRHPFVYLVEAADDICYRIIDLEDAHRLGIIGHAQVTELLTGIIEAITPGGRAKAMITYEKIGDTNEKISYLRAKVINLLTNEAANIFWNNRQAILQGTFNDTLLDNMENRIHAFKELMSVSADKIYNHDTVLEVEIAGYNVMSALLGLVVPALLKQNPDHKDQKVLKLFPSQFTEFQQTTSPYHKVLNAFDFISGMTDLYATEMYRKLKGVEIPRHQ